jgi:hypothetical protein
MMQPLGEPLVPTTACIRSGNPLCSGWYQARACSRLENHHWYQLQQPASAREIPFVPVGTKQEPAAAWRTTTGTNYSSLHPLGTSPLFRLVPGESLQPLGEPLVPTTAACICSGNPLCSGWYQVRACSCSENHWYQLQPASAREIPFVPVSTKQELAAAQRTTGTNYSPHLLT